MKKQIPGYDNYFIYDDGMVINTLTNRILSGSIGENGYKYYRLSKNNQKKMFYAHRLVAEAFLDNPNHLPVVNHKDGNKLNNNVNNLEWVSYNENMSHFHHNLKNNHTHQKTEKYVEDLPTEKWEIVPMNPNYAVSSLGRVRNLLNNNLLRSITTCGYQKVRLSTNGKITDYLVHKLVFFTFHKELTDTKTYCIDHIDGNKNNNALSNLRQIKLSDNVMFAYYSQRTNSNIKPIIQYSLDGQQLNIFPSAREAARQLNLDSSSIIKCCKGKLKTTGNFIFHYA